jgi:hypothetical protein
MHPSNRTVRLAPMRPVIQAIPTFSTYQGCIPPRRVSNLDMPTSLMILVDRLILLNPFRPAIRVVGIFGRTHG